MNLKMVIEYDGMPFNGWQKQAHQLHHQKTIQQEIETALSQILRCPISLCAAGRTDTGVHARHQVVNFFTLSKINLEKLRYSANRLLFPYIAIKHIKVVSDNFSARFSAKMRTYRYFITEVYSPFKRNQVALFPPALYGVLSFDVKAMNKAANLLIGNFDFSAFCKKKNTSNKTFCNVFSAFWKRSKDGLLAFEISANRFLRSMVRSLVGGMVLIGAKKLTLEEFKDVFHGKSKNYNIPLSPPNGLFLWDVSY